jgi:ABC-type glycerol-3-phosphate transport system substrate-binding protein
MGSFARRCLPLLTVVLLLACGPQLALPSPAPTPEPTMRPTAPPTPQPTAPPAITAHPAPTAPPRGLTLWAVASGPQLAALQAIIGELSRDLAAPVTVIGKSANGLHADLRANELAGLPPPDLIVGSQDDLGLLHRAGAIQPAGDELDASAFIPATIAGATLDGERWGMPLAARGFLLLLYNRRLVEAPPRTSDELIVGARQQTAGDRYGLVAGWAEARWFVTWLNGFGGAAVGPDGTPTLDTPQTVAALNLLKELRVAGPPPPSTYTEGVALFAQGHAAFAIDGDWAIAGYRQYTDTLDLAVAPLPVVPATGKVAAPPLDGVYLLYSKTLGGTRLEQARTLGRALAQPATQARLARALGYLPALRAALADPAVTSDPVLTAAAAQLDGAPGLPPIPGLRCAWGAIEAELPPVLLGEVTQEDAARRMQERAMACMGGRG